VFAACGESDETVPDAQPSTTVASPTATARPIIVKDFSFSGLEVKAGAKLLVQNEGPSPHTLTADDKTFDTGQVAPGSNVQFTVPSRTGTYKVRCTIHPDRMTGELKVT
jgi:plastocyanin